MAIAVDDIPCSAGATRRAAGTAGSIAGPVAAAQPSPARRCGRAVGARTGVRQRRRRAAVLALAAVSVVGLAPALVGLRHTGNSAARTAATAVASQPRPLVIASGEAGAGVVSAVVIDSGQSVWDAVAPYAPEGLSLHEWAASVLEYNDLDAAAVPAGTLVRLP